MLLHRVTTFTHILIGGTPATACHLINLLPPTLSANSFRTTPITEADSTTVHRAFHML